MANLEIDRPIDSTFKMVKAILRVRIPALKPYPYNNICQFTDALSSLISHLQNDIYHFSDAKKINVSGVTDEVLGRDYFDKIIYWKELIS